MNIIKELEQIRWEAENGIITIGQIPSYLERIIQKIKEEAIKDGR